MWAPNSKVEDLVEAWRRQRFKFAQGDLEADAKALASPASSGSRHFLRDGKYQLHPAFF